MIGVIILHYKIFEKLGQGRPVHRPDLRNTLNSLKNKSAKKIGHILNSILKVKTEAN